MRTFLSSILTSIFFFSHATDLTISRPILYMEKESTYALFNVKWENAWRNSKNHDAIWLFIKSKPDEGGFRHILVEQEGHEVVSVFSTDQPKLNFEVSEDGVGLFLFPENEYQGNVEATIKVMLERDSFQGINTRNADLTAYGIEMVKIPAGLFQLGDPDTISLDYGSFFKPNRKGNFKELVTLDAEDQSLEVSASGDIFYRKKEGYEGDQSGIIPGTFPKGVASFYMMKYEISEGDYAHFLNSLHDGQLTERIIINEGNYTVQGGTIQQENGKFMTAFPDKPCSFLSWGDAMAYADWAGLRPMTEFEFTKAARGPATPLEGEFPWGSNDKLKVQRLPNENGMLNMINGWEESQLTEDTKEYFGASYYWVMDLAGSLWERVISVGHPEGRNFIGSHGDGMITDEGRADTETWPSGDEESGGVGFRGGGFYGYAREYHEFNPFSPIAYRPYGGWHGTMRSNAYGTRLVRTSN